MIHGENLILAINGTALAASKSCNIEKAQSFIEVASPTDGRWEAYKPQKLAWSLRSDCLLSTMDAYKELDAAWKAGTPLTVRFFDTEYNENETGTVYIEKLSLSASKGNLAKMSVSLKGSGELSDYAGTNITYDKSLEQDGKYYKSVIGSLYDLETREGGKVYIGSISLSKRTLVQITARNNTMFFSQSNTITRKASDGDPIIGTDYSKRISTNSTIWFDAGTWYIVISSQLYVYDPILKAMSL